MWGKVFLFQTSYQSFIPWIAAVITISNASTPGYEELVTDAQLVYLTSMVIVTQLV